MSGAPSGRPAGGGRWLGEVLDRLKREWQLRAPAADARLEEALREAVGAEHAAHVRLAGVRRGVATVAVDCPARLQELRAFSQRQILERLRRERPALDGLRFAVGGE